MGTLCELNKPRYQHNLIDFKKYFEKYWLDQDTKQSQYMYTIIWSTNDSHQIKAIIKIRAQK